VKKVFEEGGCELLDDYINAHTPLQYKCSCGGIAKISFSGFKQGKRCRSCCSNKLANYFRLSYDYVKQFFADQGCELLEMEYKNARAKLRYRCVCGEESEIVFDSFRKGNRCRKCGNKKIAEKQTLTHEHVKLYFQSKGCELLDNYVRSAIPVRYRCKCGEESKTTLSNFKKHSRCPTCSLKGRSGENHYEWRPDRESVILEHIFRQRCYKILKCGLNATGRIKNNRTAILLGYNNKQLQERITKHPAWEQVKNNIWHVDHVFPVKAFVDYNIQDIKLINTLENLRPMIGKENCGKSGSYNKSDFELWLKLKGFNYGTRNNRV